MNGWYDVTDFGAKGDGKAPTHEAIKDAIKTASEANGGVVWFPPGRYC